jgi:hypothetical protein
MANIFKQWFTAKPLLGLHPTFGASSSFSVKFPPSQDDGYPILIVNA